MGCSFFPLRNGAKVALGAAFFCFSIGFGFDNGNNSPDHKTLKNLLKHLKNIHSEPFKDSNEYSRRIHRLYMGVLDPKKLFFISEEVEALDLYKEFIDDHMKDPRFEVMVWFFSEATKWQRSAVDRAERIAGELLETHAFDYERGEFLDADYDGRSYAADEQDLRERWRRHLKSLLMDRLFVAEQPMSAADARSSLRSQVSLYFSRERALTDDDRFHQYLDALTTAYDPHTQYFSPAENQWFNNLLGNGVQDAGLVLAKEGDFIKVVRVVAGGPAWRQGGLEDGDLILKIDQGDKKPVSAVGMPYMEAVVAIQGEHGTVVRFTVRRSTGEVFEGVPIVRGSFELGQNQVGQVRFAVGEVEEKRYGVIHLPAFYYPQRGRKGGSAAEVERALLKLMEQNVNGIVLDLRDNPGGSPKEVSRIVGLFIGKRPLVVSGFRGARHKKPRLRSLNTEPKKPLPYEGPLVVLVSRKSSSGADMLPSVLQDYNRALIVGQRTFGKGTANGVYRLGSPDMGTVKITSARFYRVNGASTLLHGVAPDIVLPTPLYMRGGWLPTARELPYVLKPDAFAPMAYKPLSNVTEAVRKKLQLRHEERHQKNTALAFMKSNEEAFRAWFDQKAIPLRRANYVEHQRKLLAWRRKVDGLAEGASGPKMVMPKSTEAERQQPSYENERRAVRAWNEQLKKDFFLLEAFYLLEDLAATSNEASTTEQPTEPSPPN